MKITALVQNSACIGVRRWTVTILDEPSEEAVLEDVENALLEITKRWLETPVREVQFTRQDL